MASLRRVADLLVDHETYTFAELREIGGAVLVEHVRRLCPPPTPKQARRDQPSRS